MDCIGGFGVGVEQNRASLNAVKDYVTQLSCPMLKSILYNTMFFKPIPTRDYNFDPNYNFHKGCNYYSGTGSKTVLVGKVMNLFLSNIRREYPILFLKQSQRFRKVYFEHEIYWDKIACESSNVVAKNYASQHVKWLDTFYSQWIIHLKRDLEKLIKQSIDHFSENTEEIIVTGTTYNLHTMRDNERILYESYLEGDNSVYLRGINYNEREAYYLKKKLMEHMISLYGDAMEYSYNANEDILLRIHRIVADEPDQQLLLPQPRRLPLIQSRMPIVDAAAALTNHDTATLQQLFLFLHEMNIASRQQHVAVPIQQNIDYLHQVLIDYENRANVLRHQDRAQTNRQTSGLRKLNIDIVMDNVEVCSGFDCAVCLDTKTTKDGHLVFSCKHEFCGSCTNQYLDDYRAKTTAPICPLCRGKIDSIVVKNPDMLENKGILNNLQNICF
jgi:hypothetical protein